MARNMDDIESWATGGEMYFKAVAHKLHDPNAHKGAAGAQTGQPAAITDGGPDGAANPRRQTDDRAIGAFLREFLAEGTTAADAEKAFKQLAGSDITLTRSGAATIRNATSSALRGKKDAVSRQTDTLARSARHHGARFDEGVVNARGALDRHLVRLTLHHYATLEREYEIHARRLEEERRICERLEAQVKQSLQLSLFSLHLENETSGRILLRRLPTSHPQHVRCRRAAVENVKADFFGPPAATGRESPAAAAAAAALRARHRYSGIGVLDVYKIENHVLLERFQQCAAATEPGKVKGLFCGVPAENIERVVTYGMLDRDPTTAERREVFRRTWYTFSDGSGGFAEKRVNKSRPIKFPRTFSRYSTLEDDRPLMLAPDPEEQAAKTAAAAALAEEKDGDADGPETNDSDDAKKSKKKKKGKKKKGAAGEEADDDDGDSATRYLVLCRVIVGKVFVTSKEYRGFPVVVGNASGSGSFDSMYNPLQEEYLLVTPQNVLPEFLVQYKYLRRRDGGDAAAAAQAAARARAKHAAAAGGKKGGKKGKKGKGGKGGGGASVAALGATLPTIIPVDLSTKEGVALPAMPPPQEWPASAAQMAAAKAGGVVDASGAGADEHSAAGANAAAAPPGGDGDAGTAITPFPLASRTPAAEPPADHRWRDGSGGGAGGGSFAREEATPWDQLRANAAVQRDRVLDALEASFDGYWQELRKAREADRRRIVAATGVDLLPLRPDVLREECDAAELELLRQVSRRRELERELQTRREDNLR